MADPIQLTTDDLMAEIGRLTMEVRARAAREDQLVTLINQMKQAAEADPPSEAEKE
jgi:hypothetical protein